MNHPTTHIRNFAPKGIWRIYCRYEVLVLIIKLFVLQTQSHPQSSKWLFWQNESFPYDAMMIVLAIVLGGVATLIYDKVKKKRSFETINSLFVYLWVFIRNPLTFHRALEEYRANQNKKIPLRGEVMYSHRHGYGVMVYNDSDKFNYLEEIHLVNEVGKTVEIFMPRLEHGEKLGIAIPPKSQSHPYLFFPNMRSIGKGFKAYLTMRNGEILETEFFNKIEKKETTS